jgi:DNA-directed RNA polymerase subunit RPC12/RpoP
MRIRTQCKSCGLPFREVLTRDTEAVVCPGCGESRQIDLGAWPEDAPETVTSCPVCACKHLYRQRDVNRAFGCLLVAIGAALVPWTYGLSLVFLALVDFWFYRRLGESVVCYRCDTVYRDAKPGPRQGEFDLLKHDVLKYGKTWQDVDVTS